MLFLELKLLLSDYKKIIIIFLVFFVLTFSATIFLKNIESRGYLFEPFTVGVVNNDKFEELDSIFSIYNSTKEMSEIINFQIMSLDDAKNEFELEKIPAYIVIPENFSNNIILGENQPITLIGNENMWMQVNLIKIIINAGISFLTTSQSGIYSIMDYYYEIGLSKSDINENLIVPINLRYGLAALGYNNYFAEKTINSTGSLNFIEFYSISICIFTLMLTSIAFLPNINISSNKNILLRYRQSQKPFIFFVFIKHLSLSLALLLITLPTIFLFRWKLVFIIMLVSSFVFFINALSENITFSSITLFFISFIFIFFSGGIIPTIFLPSIFNLLKKFTINYYLYNLDLWYHYVYWFIIFVFLNFCSYLLLIKRRDS